MNSQLCVHPSVKAYCQHGFSPEGESGNEIYGDCPFCLHEKKLYVNKETKAWSCKYCQREGGFLTFLETTYQLCETAFKGKVAIDLCKNKGLDISTMRYFHIGYNVLTKAYTLPIFEFDGKRIQDLRFYLDKKFHSTFSCRVGLLNVTAALGSEKVWICEGEFDGMAMYEILNNTEREKEIPIAVPGAGTFKPEWIELLQNKHVKCLYDNDEAGKKGSEKVFNLIRPVSKSLYFLHWTPEKKDGYDIRDLHNENSMDFSDCMKYIIDNLGDIPPGMTAEDILSRQGGNKSEEYDGEGLECSDVYEGYKKHLHLPDTDVIDIIYGTLIANRMQGDPIWLFLVAPPGMTKTEFLQSVSKGKNIHCVSKLTPKALVSGLNIGGHDPSLLPKLNGKTLVIKDFTAIFGMNAQARDEIFSTLRDAYDGNFIGVYGHGERNYVSRFGIIAGVTPAVEIYLEGEAALGERFLRYTTKLPKTLLEHLAYLERATGNTGKETNMRDALVKLGTACLNYKFADSVVVPPEIHRKILHLAVWMTRLRATIIRDRYTKEVTHKPFMEMATRVSKQFVKLLMGVTLFRRKDVAGEEEYLIIKKLARGTVPSRIEETVRKIYNKSGTFTQGEIAELIGLPASTCARVAEDLTLSKVLEVNRLALFKSDYKLTEDFLNIIVKSEVYK